MLEPSLTSWNAHYDRLARGYSRVIARYRNSVDYDDDVQHFLQDAWHLKDWLKNDPALKIGEQIEDLVKTKRSLMICADLANGSKHMVRDWHRVGANVVSKSVTLVQGGADMIHVITLADGSQTTLDVVVKEVWSDWNELLKGLGLV